MKKIIVIGCPGSGKSRFSLKLAELTGIPLHHLDLLYWNADKTKVDRETFRARLREVLATDSWIIDGNYSSTMELRMEVCDTVFLFDYPAELCLLGLAERFGKPRVDMPWVETEPDLEFTEYVRSFVETDRPKIYERLEKYPGREVIVFKSREQTDEYLAELAKLASTISKT